MLFNAEPWKRQVGGGGEREDMRERRGERIDLAVRAKCLGTLGRNCCLSVRKGKKIEKVEGALDSVT